MTSTNKTQAAVRMTRQQAGLFRRFKDEEGQPGWVAVHADCLLFEPLSCIGGAGGRWQDNEDLARWVKRSFRRVSNGTWTKLVSHTHLAKKQAMNKALEFIARIPAARARTRIEKLLSDQWGDVQMTHPKEFALLRTLTRKILTFADCKELHRAIFSLRDYNQFIPDARPFEVYDLGKSRLA
jgi:hypothetical protein